MKSFFLKTMLLPLSLLAACGNNSRHIKDFIPGTYVNEARSSYSFASDTLQITPDVLTENHYRVIRKTGFNRLSTGKLQPRARRVKTFTGIWDQQKQALTIMQNGVVLLFQPGGNQLLIENSTYRKIVAFSTQGTRSLLLLSGAHEVLRISGGAYENL
jgi:hypothetical protein